MLWSMPRRPIADVHDRREAAVMDTTPPQWSPAFGRTHVKVFESVTSRTAVPRS